MRIIGLTGGIGAGKSAAASCFREYGIPVIDADLVGRELIETDATLREALLDAFGTEILDNDAISREKLADCVFADPEALARINTLLHPVIIADVSRQCADYFAKGHSCVIVEAALIGETGRRAPWLSGLILVRAAESVRLSRLQQSRGMSEAEARRRMAAQYPPDLKLDIADWIIDNNGDLDMLRGQVRAVVTELEAGEMRTSCD